MYDLAVVSYVSRALYVLVFFPPSSVDKPINDYRQSTVIAFHEQFPHASKLFLMLP